MVGWHRTIWAYWAGRNHWNNSAGFRDNWMNPEHRRFYEENVYNHFIISFGMILLFQLIFLFIYLIVKLIYWGSLRKV